MSRRTILFVSGFSSSLRAKDLAWEFERFGRLVRCDIPALRSQSSAPYAFIEFRDDRDAEDAYYDMHGRMIDGRRISVQWAKNPPSRAWRFDSGAGGPPPRDSRDRDYDRRREPSPRRESRRSQSPSRGRDEPPRNGHREQSPPPRRETRSPAADPAPRGSRSPEPEAAPASKEDEAPRADE